MKDIPTREAVIECIKHEALKILEASNLDGGVEFLGFVSYGQSEGDEGVVISARLGRACERVGWTKFQRLEVERLEEVRRRGRQAARRLAVKLRASLSRAKA